MTTSLLWDAGPGEIRTGLVENSTLTEFRIIRLRRGERALLAAGEHYTARIKNRLGQGKALVTLGGDHDAILQPAPKVPDGTLLAVAMTRSPVPEPGRWKLPMVRPAPDVTALAEPGWHFSAEPWEIFPRKMAGSVHEFICKDAASANELRNQILPPASPPVRIDAAAIADADFGSLIDQSVSGEFAIDGGMLTIERTRAMTMIDIDGSGDALALNLSAAREIPKLLRLLDIGGQIGIDFLSVADRPARQAVDAELAQACAILGQHERTAANGFGFVQIVRPRTGPSIPETVCGTFTGRLSLESRAIALLRDAGRSVGHGTRQLVSQPAIIDLIRRWPEETMALQSALGVKIELVSDPAAIGYGHVHVSQ
jgi:Ribonuclease E/G family